MKGIELVKPDIQKHLINLKEANAINGKYHSYKKDDSLIVAVILENVPSNLKDLISDFEFKKKEFAIDFKTALANILNRDELEQVKTAYDIIGTIAVVEIDDVLSHKAKDIAQCLLDSSTVVKTVVRKSGAHSGTLRIQEYEFLAGEKTFETIHKENGARLKLILGQVYYSPRSTTERNRVFSQVKNGENVLVMFSGCGPFVCTIGKNTAAKHIVGIELNEVGHELAVENVKLNKLSNVDMIQGDVREVCPELKDKGFTFDRIVMPLPKTAEEFLPEAFMVAKEGTVIHLYDFVDEQEFPKVTVDKIETYAKECGIEYEVLDTVKCGQFAPYIFRVCVDFVIKKKTL